MHKFLLIFSLVLIPSLLFAGEIKLKWSAVPEATGYKIYYGISSDVLENELDVGNVTSISISNLTTGLTYYFKASCYSDTATSALSSGVFGEPKLSTVIDLAVE